MVLLDTDIMIDILRQYDPAQAWLQYLGQQTILLPEFVSMELIQGCQNLTEQRTLMNTLSAYHNVSGLRKKRVIKRYPFFNTIISVITWASLTL